MQKILVVFFPVLIFLFCVDAMDAQFPGRKNDPAATPSPTPTPEQKAQPCPNVSVQAQTQMVRDGQPINFSANIASANPGNPATIEWSTSAGTITKGQYSPHIEVDSTGAGSLPEREIKAEVFISGYAPECVLQASAIVKIIAPATKFGEFGEVAAETVTKHLKTMADVLAQSPDNLSLVIYSGRNSERNFASAWYKRLRDELVADGVNIRRINVIDGGFREQPVFEFWLVPLGAEQPRPAPTIKREEIVYPKPPPKKP